MVIILFFSHNPISLKHLYCFEEILVTGTTPNHMPLNFRCLIEMSNRIIHAYLTLMGAIKLPSQVGCLFYPCKSSLVKTI